MQTLASVNADITERQRALPSPSIRGTEPLKVLQRHQAGMFGQVSETSCGILEDTKEHHAPITKSHTMRNATLQFYKQIRRKEKKQMEVAPE